VRHTFSVTSEPVPENVCRELLRRFGLGGVQMLQKPKDFQNGVVSGRMSSNPHAIDSRVAHAVTIGEVPSLERFQAIPNGKCRLTRSDEQIDEQNNKKRFCQWNLDGRWSFHASI